MCFVAVNDPYVMRAWEESQKAKGKVLMLSDGNGDLSAAVRELTPAETITPPNHQHSRKNTTNVRT